MAWKQLNMRPLKDSLAVFESKLLHSELAAAPDASFGCINPTESGFTSVLSQRYPAAGPSGPPLAVMRGAAVRTENMRIVINGKRGRWQGTKAKVLDEGNARGSRYRNPGGRKKVIWNPTPGSSAEVNNNSIGHSKALKRKRSALNSFAGDIEAALSKVCSSGSNTFNTHSEKHLTVEYSSAYIGASVSSSIKFSFSISSEPGEKRVGRSTQARIAKKSKK